MDLNFIDIGGNMADGRFSGIYGCYPKHRNDREFALQRAWKQGVKKIIITVGSVYDEESALDIAGKDERLYLIMGFHPARDSPGMRRPPDEQHMEEYYAGLHEKIALNTDKVVAIGECGLDYDRELVCGRETQLKFFEKQLELAVTFTLPLFFFHCSASHTDFMALLERNKDKIAICGGGVVHSFTGTLEEAQAILSFCGLYIGINGDSLETAENLAVVKEIPNDRIMLQTSHGIATTYAGYKFVRTQFPTVELSVIEFNVNLSSETLVNGRDEPCQIRQVLEVVAAVKEQSVEELAPIFYQNSLNLFFSKKK